MDIDATLARRLIAARFPEWSHLPVTPVVPGGWDNRSFRVGESMVARFPSDEEYAASVDKERRWLPRLAPGLPLPIPEPLALGPPACGYPWKWAMYRWLEGEPAATARISDPTAFASSLAAFLVALHRIDPSGGPEPGPHNFFRGGSLRVYDGETRSALAALRDRIDPGPARAIWEAALAATWSGPPVWVHGDVNVGNLLIREGRLAAVIDFGQLGVGDPACDLTMAWTFFDEPSRAAFRDGLSLDDATWTRARGWALWKALIVLAERPGANPGHSAESRRALEALF